MVLCGNVGCVSKSAAFLDASGAFFAIMAAVPAVLHSKGTLRQGFGGFLVGIGGHNVLNWGAMESIL